MDKARMLVLLVKNFLAKLGDENDFFLPMKYFLVVGGIHLPTKDTLYRRLFVCYRILLGLLFFVWVDRFYVALFKWKNREDLIGVSTFFVAIVMISLRVVLIWFYLEKLEPVCAFLDRQLNENRSGRRDQSYRLVRRIALVLEVTFVLDQVMFYAFGVGQDRMFCTPDNLSRLGWRVKLFFDVTNSISNLIYSSLYAAILTVHKSLLMAFEVELGEAVLEFGRVFQRVDMKLNEVIGKDERLKKQPMLREALEESLFWNVLEKELNSIIMRHSDLLEQLGTLGGYFKLTFLLMFYMEIVVLGCASFYSNGQELSIKTTIVASYAAANLLECYWFCRLVDNLNDTNGKIGSAAYNLDWHQRLRKVHSSTKMYCKIRTSLLMVMTKSQQNLGITCGGMFEMSVEAFQNLLNMIYSLLMFLLNTTA